MNPSTALLLLCCFLATSCATRPVRLGTPCSMASAQLAAAWKALSDAVQTPGGCEPDNGMRCDVLRARIERLSIDCPNHPELVMANALLAFEARNFARTQQLLDELFSIEAPRPEAVILRARIALEQGNLPFAVRFLDQQIHQTGDHSGLRETYASALYLAGRRDEARAQLTTAQRLGAPVWRIAYGLGLIEEADGRFDQARLRYEEALQGKPGWKQADSRLRALIASGKVPM